MSEGNNDEDSDDDDEEEVSIEDFPLYFLFFVVLLWK